MRHGVLRSTVAAAAFGVMMCAAQPALAGAVSREDFSFPAETGLNVVVFRPDVHVGSLKVGGLDEPNVEWTEAARANMQAALEASTEFKDAKITFVDELEGDADTQLLNEYRGLFETVAGSMFTHVTNSGQMLPTKQYMTKPPKGSAQKPKKKSKIDWTLGEGAAKLRDVTGSDYAMFVFTHDSYGDSGRKAAQALGMLGCLIGVCMIIPAGVHIGYAGLVELETGNIVWFNTDLAMGGDVREADGATKRVGQLLAGFPKRDGVETVAVKD